MINSLSIEIKRVLFLALLFASVLPRVTHAQALKVMTYNIHHGQDEQDRDMLMEMADFVKAMSPDIVALQEVDSVCKRSGNIDQAKFLAEKSGMHYAFVRHFAFDGGAYGQALLSKYPISEIENKRLPISTGASTALLAAKIDLPKEEKVLVFVAHLDYRSTDSRLSQVHIINELAKQSSHPVILAGDLNAEPNDQEIRVLLENWASSLDAVPTFPVSPPEKKIDYIMYDKNWGYRLSTSRVFNVQFSDHLPMMDTFVLEPLP